jgi:hypothetical protein
MADDPDPQYPTAEQYRERANLVRQRAETMNDADIRRQLLNIAMQYERLADSMTAHVLTELRPAPLGSPDGQNPKQLLQVEIPARKGTLHPRY